MYGNIKNMDKKKKKNYLWSTENSIKSMTYFLGVVVNWT